MKTTILREPPPPVSSQPTRALVDVSPGDMALVAGAVATLVGCILAGYSVGYSDGHKDGLFSRLRGKGRAP